MSTSSTIYKGQTAAPGICFGPVYFIDRTDFNKELLNIVNEDFNASVEIAKFETAVSKALNDLTLFKEQANKSTDLTKLEILDAHESLIDDPEVKDQTIQKITTDKKFAAIAYNEVITSFKTIFSNLNDPYMQQRVLDLEDISRRVLFYILHPKSTYSQIQLDLPSIVVADDMSPSEVLGLDRSKILGIVLINGSTLSHTAILARSMEIPCLVGVHDFKKIHKSTFSSLIIDTQKEILIVNPSPVDLISFNTTLEEEKARKELLASLKGQPTRTKKGHQVPLGANISGPQDCDSVINNDAELVGLYRTEFLFLERATPPDEEEQYNAYANVFKKLGAKRIVIRTLDIGGDKKVPYLNIEKEENPFLGVRGIRLCLQNQDLFRTQIRAILRASIFCSDLGIMFPMVSTINEIITAKQLIADIKKELALEQIQFGAKINIGVMMEVPSLAWILKEVAEEVSFISIGTNDLFQYSNACDRMNINLKSISSPTHTGFLRFLKFIISEAKTHNLHVGVCGSIAHHSEIMPYLIAAGVDDLSMTAQHILLTRSKIASL